MQSALAPLADGTAFSTFTASASGKGLTASAGKGAVAGSYAIDVHSIATSQSITSGAFTSKAALGAGSLTLSLGGKSTTITIQSGKSTLADIASAINSAAGNPGVSATVVNGVDGAHLMLHANTTGLANGINVQVKSGDAEFNKLSVKSSISTTTPATTVVDDSGNWKQSVAGQDAHLSISGMEVSSPSNIVTSAIDGLTLNLTADAVSSSPQTLTIAQDVTDQKTAIGAFVTAYNNFVTTAASFTGFDATKKHGSQGGALLGDATMNAIRNTLSGAMSGGLKESSGAATLAGIGITFRKDGTLKTDDLALTNALTNNSTGVAALFNSKTGLAASLNTSLTSFLKTGGTLDMHSNRLTTDLKSLADQQTQLNDYTDKLTKGYNAQFTAVNRLMSQMAKNGDYLTALFGGKNSAGAMASNK
jgi:flagellar hook-associated protein 2